MDLAMAANTHIQAQRVEIAGTDDGGSIYSGIFSEARASSNGNAGNITLAANELILKDGWNPSRQNAEDKGMPVILQLPQKIF